MLEAAKKKTAPPPPPEAPAAKEEACEADDAQECGEEEAAEEDAVEAWAGLGAPKNILLRPNTVRETVFPKVLGFQLVRIGQMVVAAVPGEFTTMAGARTKEAIKKILVDGGVIEETGTVVLNNVASGYAGYVTTYEEYQHQRYEGGFTTYGPYTHEAMTNILVQMAEESRAPQLTRKDQDWENIDRVLVDDPPIGGQFGDVKEDVHPGPHWPGDTVRCTLWGAHPRNHLQRNSSFGTVWRWQPNNASDVSAGGSWVFTADDSDFDTMFSWRREGISASLVTISWTAEVSFNNVMKNLYVKIAEQGKMEDSEIEAFLDDLLDSLSDDHVDNLLQQSAKHESITQYIQFVKLVHGVDDDWIYVGEDGDPLEDFKDFVRWLVRARVGPVKEVPPNAAPAQVEKVPEDTAEAQAPHNAAPAEVEEQAVEDFLKEDENAEPEQQEVAKTMEVNVEESKQQKTESLKAPTQATSEAEGTYHVEDAEPVSEEDLPSDENAFEVYLAEAGYALEDEVEEQDAEEVEMLKENAQPVKLVSTEQLMEEADAGAWSSVCYHLAREKRHSGAVTLRRHFLAKDPRAQQALRRATGARLALLPYDLCVAFTKTGRKLHDLNVEHPRWLNPKPSKE
eukprot:g28385.t1